MLVSTTLLWFSKRFILKLKQSTVLHVLADSKAEACYYVIGKRWCYTPTLLLKCSFPTLQLLCPVHSHQRRQHISQCQSLLVSKTAKQHRQMKG